MLHNKIHIILIYLWLTDENEVSLVTGSKAFEVVNVPGKALDVPEHCREGIKLDVVQRLRIRCVNI